MYRTVVNCETGEITQVEITGDDLAQIEAIAANYVPPPDVDGFVMAIKTELGGIVAVANILNGTASMFYESLKACIWTDAQELIINSHQTNALSDAQYSAIKEIAVQYNIPITLP